MREDDKDERRPLEVRRIRSQHGTQVARRIECSICGRVDHLRFAPRKTGEMLCRNCAAEHIGVEDRSSNIRPQEMRTCLECEAQYRSPVELRDEGRCAKCESKRLSRSNQRRRSGPGVVRKNAQ